MNKDEQGMLIWIEEEKLDKIKKYVKDRKELASIEYAVLENNIEEFLEWLARESE